MIETANPTNTKNVLLNDIIAKKIFKNELLGKKITSRIISDLLNYHYDQILHNLKQSDNELAFSSLTVTNAADIVYYNIKNYYDIEINYRKYKNKPKVLCFYIYQLILGQVHNSNNYKKVKEVIQINIDAYDFYKQKQFIYVSYDADKKTHQRRNKDYITYHINLAYLRKNYYNMIISEKNKIAYDLFFLICNDNEKINEVYKGDIFMKKVISNAKQIAGNEKLDLFLSEEELIKMEAEESFNKGVKKGIAQGANEKEKSFITNMIKEKFSLETIAKCTGLTLDKVKNLVNTYGLL